MSKAKLFRLEEAKQVASQKEGARIISQKNALEACIVSVDCQYAKFEE
jgi:hypothetical protein